jgi:hypothetical protein
MEEGMADRHAVALAVPADHVLELEQEGLAFAVPVFRGAVLDAVVTVGMDASTLVTLLQAPDSVRAFAAWVRGRCARSGNSIELTARRGDLRMHLMVDGDIDVSVVAAFLEGAFKDPDSGL